MFFLLYIYMLNKCHSKFIYVFIEICWRTHTVYTLSNPIPLGNFVIRNLRILTNFRSFDYFRKFLDHFRNWYHLVILSRKLRKPGDGLSLGTFS